MRVMMLALTIGWLSFALAQTQPKPTTSGPLTAQQKVAQAKKQPAKLPEFRVILVGRVENKQEPAVEGVDFGSPRRTAQGMLATVGNCGWMSLTSSSVDRVYLAVTEAKDGDGRVIPELDGQSFRIACENADEVGRFRGELVQVHGVIREGTQLKGKEIGVVSVAETSTPRANPAKPTDLLSASASGDIEGVKRAILGGVDVNTRNEFGMIPVSTALHPTGSYTKMIGANRGETALILAARQGYVEIVKFLLQEGANAKAADSRGETALAAAKESGYSEIVQILSQPAAAGVAESGETLERLPSKVTQPAQRTKPTRREPIKVSDNVQESRLIRRVEPAYPELAKRARVQGRVVLIVIVDEEGNVADIRISSGHPLLDEAAISAVRQWKYSPAVLNGEPVPVTATVTVIFNLK